MRLGAILAIWMMLDDNDHLGLNDSHAKLYSLYSLMGHWI